MAKDYVLIDWVGGPDGKIFGPRSWRTDLAALGPCPMTEGQIFSRPARPNSVNKHFIIWPQHFSFHSFLSFLFSFFRPAFVVSRAFSKANDITPFIWEASEVYLNSANCNVQNISMCFEWNNLQSKVLIFTKSRSRSKFDSTIHTIHS